MEFATEKALRGLVAKAGSANVAKLAEKVLGLQTSDKFRLAALLLDTGKVSQAEAVGTRACQEIQLAYLFTKKP